MHLDIWPMSREWREMCGGCATIDQRNTRSHSMVTAPTAMPSGPKYHRRKPPSANTFSPFARRRFKAGRPRSGHCGPKLAPQPFGHVVVGHPWGGAQRARRDGSNRARDRHCRRTPCKPASWPSRARGSSLGLAPSLPGASPCLGRGTRRARFRAKVPASGSGVGEDAVVLNPEPSSTELGRMASGPGKSGGGPSWSEHTLGWFWGLCRLKSSKTQPPVVSSKASDDKPTVRDKLPTTIPPKPWP